MTRETFDAILHDAAVAAATTAGADPRLLRTDPATRFSALVRACCPDPGIENLLRFEPLEWSRRETDLLESLGRGLGIPVMRRDELRAIRVVDPEAMEKLRR